MEQCIDLYYINPTNHIKRRQPRHDQSHRCRHRMSTRMITIIIVTAAVFQTSRKPSIGGMPAIPQSLQLQTNQILGVNYLWMILHAPV